MSLRHQLRNRVRFWSIVLSIPCVLGLWWISGLPWSAFFAVFGLLFSHNMEKHYEQR